MRLTRLLLTRQDADETRGCKGQDADACSITVSSHIARSIALLTGSFNLQPLTNERVESFTVLHQVSATAQSAPPHLVHATIVVHCRLTYMTVANLRMFPLLVLLSLFGSGALAHGHVNDHRSHNSTGEEPPAHQRGHCNSPPLTVRQRSSMMAVKEWAKPRGSISSRQSSPVYTVPVIIHVLANQTHPNVVTETKLKTMIESMNDDFQRSNAPFIFDLKKITRTIKDDWYNCTEEKEEVLGNVTGNDDEFRGALYEGNLGTLNVYMCSLFRNSEFYGYATRPGDAPGWRDGVGKTKRLMLSSILLWYCFSGTM
jgi:hypothetical protein